MMRHIIAPPPSELFRTAQLCRLAKCRLRIQHSQQPKARPNPDCVCLLQDRKLLQIDDSATTVDAAPLAAADSSSSALGSDLLSSNNGTMPHTILSDVISAYKNKFSKSAGAPAPSTSSIASATSSGSSTSPTSSANATSSALSSTSGDSNTSSHHITSELISELKDKQLKHGATAPASSTSGSSATANATATASDGDDYYNAPCPSEPVPSQYEAFEEVSILLRVAKFHQKTCMPVCLPACIKLFAADLHALYPSCFAVEHSLACLAFSAVPAQI